MPPCRQAISRQLALTIVRDELEFVMGWFRKFRGAVDEFGLAKGMLYVVNRGLNPIGSGIYIYHFVAQPIPETSLLPASRGRSILVKEIERGDPILLTMPLDQRVIDYRLAQHATCLGAFKDDRMIGCVWLCLGPYKEDEVRCRFSPFPEGQTSWDFDFYLVPEQRLGLAFARLWDEANIFLRSRGVKWSMSRISTLNLSSLASHGRLGTREIGRALFINFWGIQLALSSVKPLFHISINVRQFPNYALCSPA